MSPNIILISVVDLGVARLGSNEIVGIQTDPSYCSTASLISIFNHAHLAVIGHVAIRSIPWVTLTVTETKVLNFPRSQTKDERQGGPVKLVQ